MHPPRDEARHTARSQALRPKNGANGQREEDNGQHRLMQMMMLAGKRDRSKHQRAKFSRRRKAENIAAKICGEIAAFAQDWQNHAEGGRRQNKRNEDRRAQQADEGEKSGEQHAERKGGEPRRRAKPEGFGANLLRVEFKSRLKEQKDQPEFAQEPNRAVA